MSRVLGLLILCVALALLKAVVVALAIALALLLLVALIRHPRDTLLCLVTLGFIGLANAQPLACILTVGVVTVAIVITAGLTRHRRKQSGQPVLLIGPDAAPN